MDQYADEVCVRPCATPLSARWLASHWDVGGGKLPYHLRGSVTASGLKPLDVERHWLVQAARVTQASGISQVFYQIMVSQLLRLSYIML